MPALVPPRLEVVARPDRLHAVALGRDGDLDELARGELLGGGLVSEGERHGDPFRSASLATASAVWSPTPWCSTVSRPSTVSTSRVRPGRSDAASSANPAAACRAAESGPNRGSNGHLGETRSRAWCRCRRRRARRRADASRPPRAPPSSSSGRSAGRSPSSTATATERVGAGVRDAVADRGRRPRSRRHPALRHRLRALAHELGPARERRGRRPPRCTRATDAAPSAAAIVSSANARASTARASSGTAGASRLFAAGAPFTGITTVHATVE